MSALKNLAKSVLYQVSPPSLPSDLRLEVFYVFHTEQIFNDEIFARLLSFCQRYSHLTGSRALSCTMSAVSPGVEAGLLRYRISPQEYADRVREIEKVADLGYHGHFWKDARLDIQNEIKGDVRDRESVSLQMNKDLNWFAENGLNHNGAYAAGWWYMNEDIIQLLLENKFKYDFSFSMSPWFRKEFSKKLMAERKIRVGESFQVNQGAQSLLCTQYLIGCHQTPFPQCFVRNLNSLLDQGAGSLVEGAVGAHDYDLDLENTLRCIEFLKNTGQVGFKGLSDLWGEPKRTDVMEECYG